MMASGSYAYRSATAATWTVVIAETTAAQQSTAYLTDTWWIAAANATSIHAMPAVPARAAPKAWRWFDVYRCRFVAALPKTAQRAQVIARPQARVDILDKRRTQRRRYLAALRRVD